MAPGAIAPRPDLEARRPCACRRQRVERLIGEVDEEVGEIHFAEEQSDRRHDDVVRERGDDLAETCADDDADSHVQHVALYRKFLEFIHHAHLVVCSFVSFSDAGVNR